MFKLNFFVPSKDKERVKEALFNIGVGRYGNYEHCAFETLGAGQFKPIKDAHPYIGKLGTIEQVEEYKVEMICPRELIHVAIKVLKETHPYEEVAYEVFKMEKF